jgi:VWFA-related protein
MILLAFVAALVLPAHPQHSTSVTVQEFEHLIAASRDAHPADADLARQMLALELTERLSTARLARLKASLPGEKSQQALIALADSSIFLDPPAAETPPKPTPDPAALHAMLVSVVKYVNTSVRQLPNFIATRDTTRFENRPQEDILGEVGTTTLIYLPLQVVGRSNVLVTYRDGHEVIEPVTAKSKRGESQERGLFTEGVFGPILTTVVGDALKGKITWSHWEQRVNDPEAVFHYAVPLEKSHYSVGFCCVTNQSDNKSAKPEDWHNFAEIAAYHGEIAFDPTNGAILRITLEADMPPNDEVSRNGMMVEYGAVDIGGKNYVCPLRSVSILLAHTTTQLPHGMNQGQALKGPPKTFLNDAVFEQYRRFGSESRIMAANSAELAVNPPAPAPESAVSTPPQPAPSAATKVPASPPVTIVAPAHGTVYAPAMSETASTPPPPTEPEISIEAASDLPGNDQPSGYTLKVTTRLVDVSLVADDKKGRPVNGLKAEDIEVYDNERRQQIKFFSPADAVPPSTGPAPAASPEDTFSNHSADAATSPATPQNNAGATILLIDEGHLAWNDMQNARTQMLQFLSSAPPSERVGIYTMNGLGFRVLVEATTDRAVLITRLQKWMPTAQSVAQAQNEETRNRQQFNEVRNFSDLASVNGNHADMPDGLSTIDPQLLTMGSNPARASLIILVGVARRLASVPGHKNLVWVSSDNVFADFRDQGVGIDRTTGTLDRFALRAQEAMNDAHVAVYPFDVSQLETSDIAADTQHRNVQLTPTNSAAGTAPIDRTAGRIKAEMLQDVHSIQWPVRQVAEATGGRAIRRSGDLAAALSEIVEDSHATYMLSFSPDQSADDQYHAITVKLTGKQHGLTLHYRTGYLYSKEPATLQDRFKQAVWQPIDSNELTVTTKVLQTDQGSNMQINIAAAGLDGEQLSEHWIDKLDIFFIQRDDAGLQADVEGQTLRLRLKPSTYQQMLSTGVPYERIVQLKPGIASLRILVVDRNSGRMGSVTIPNSALTSDKH